MNLLSSPRHARGLFRSVLAAALLAFTTPAWGEGEVARAPCSTLFSTGPKIQYEIRRMDPLLTDQHVREITDVLDRTAALVSPHLAVPDTLRLHLSYRNRAASASVGGSTLTLPYQIISQLKTAGAPARFKHPRHTHAVIAHELGHAIFSKNFDTVVLKLKDNFKASILKWARGKQPNYDQLNAELNQLRQIKAAMEKAYLAQLDEWGSGGDPKLKAQIGAVEARSRALQAQMPPDPLAGFNMGDFRTAYEELFADVVAISVLQNPRAVFASVMPISRDEASVRSRNFLRPMDAQNWHQTKVHDVFGPVRYYLSQDPRSVALFRENPGQLIKVVYDAIVADLEQLSHAAHRLPGLSIAERNERLIASVRAKLAEAHPAPPAATTSH